MEKDTHFFTLFTPYTKERAEYSCKITLSFQWIFASLRSDPWLYQGKADLEDHETPCTVRYVISSLPRVLFSPEVVRKSTSWHTNKPFHRQ